jgi:hypothetical protein
MGAIIFREPGAGAIDYTKQFTEGLTRDQAAPVITALLKGELHDPTDKRVKRCDYCGYYWRDDSLRNTRRTCSSECKTGIKTLQKRQQRADAALLNPQPRKRTLMDDYIWWLEYPFWINEYSMIKIGWKFEKPSGVALMDYVKSGRGQMGDGNRRKSRSILSGDKKVLV